jgi:hypothetical protein
MCDIRFARSWAAAVAAVAVDMFCCSSDAEFGGRRKALPGVGGGTGSVGLGGWHCVVEFNVYIMRKGIS